MNRFLFSRSIRHAYTAAPKLRFFCSTRKSESEPTSISDPVPKSDPPTTDVTNSDFKRRIELYLQNKDEQALPSITEAAFSRIASGKHTETDDELIEELKLKPLDNVKDREFEEDFEEIHDTDEELDDLYNAKDYVERKMVSDEFFNMDDKKWDEMVKEGIEGGFLKDTRECEGFLEDMMSWDKLLPDEIKKKVEAKFNELADMCESGELDPGKAYELFKEFEDQMVLECQELMKTEQPPEEEGIVGEDKSSELIDPPGKGPILRWESRVVFAPGGDAYHPKNRKVKLSVTVKELGLSKYAYLRLREVVGKRYHSGRDELTITSERFDHREENRKDCLRTLYALIEDARKADKLVEEARNAYIKDRLRSNPQFMERLKAKVAKMQGSPSLSV